jgi:hypothetical protein
MNVAAAMESSPLEHTKPFGRCVTARTERTDLVRFRSFPHLLVEFAHQTSSSGKGFIGHRLPLRLADYAIRFPMPPLFGRRTLRRRDSAVR